MATAFKLEQFEGPLELLLTLIEEEKLPLTDISLARVTEQFLQQLKEFSEEGTVEKTAEVADFLVVATKLLYLKSRLLLPYLEPEEADGPTLADQLKLYKEYVSASKEIARLWERSLLGYGRSEPPLKAEGFMLPTNAKAAQLEKTFAGLVKRLRPLKALPQVAIDRTISLKEKIEAIYAALQNVTRFTLRSLTNEAENRTEVIVTFLAILELAKQQRVQLKQETCFSDLELIIA